jgi:hypothetical protein
LAGLLPGLLLLLIRLLLSTALLSALTWLLARLLGLLSALILITLGHSYLQFLPPPIIGDLAHTDLADRVSNILAL